jgi:hypothetical protein
MNGVPLPVIVVGVSAGSYTKMYHIACSPASFFLLQIDRHDKIQ